MRQCRIGDYRIKMWTLRGLKFGIRYRPELDRPANLDGRGGRGVDVWLAVLGLSMHHRPGAPDWWGRVDPDALWKCLLEVLTADVDAQMMGLEP